MASLILARPAAADPGEESVRLALAPDLRVFVTTEEGELNGAVRRGARQQWRTDPALKVHVIDDETLHRAVTDAALYEGTLSLARQWGEMGVEAYRQVQSQAAVDHLERAIQNFSTIGHEVVAPEEIAEVLLYLALSYLEDGENVVRPLDLMQEMIRRDPSLRLERGYYPDFIVRYYESARDTLFRELRQQGPPLEESRRIAELVDADFVFHGYVIPGDDDGVELIAYLYDRAEDDYLPGERLALSEVSPELIQEGFSRLSSRLSACLIDAPVADVNGSDLGSSRGTGRLAVQLGLAYGSFIQTPAPIRRSFGNYGAGLGMGWAVTREFQIIGGLQVFNSMRDYDGFLREDFTTIRVLVGGQVGRQLGPLHLALGAGMEASSFGPMRVFTDPGCIAAPDDLCPGDVGTATFEDRGLHLGISLRPRIAVPLADSFQLSSSLGLGYYFSPLSDRLLNFPVIGEMGIQYRF